MESLTVKGINELRDIFQLFTIKYSDCIDCTMSCLKTITDHNFGFLFVYLEAIVCDRPFTPVTHCYTSDWVSQLTVGLLTVGLFYWTVVMKQLNANKKRANLSSILHQCVNRDRLSQSQNPIRLSQGRYLAGSFLFSHSVDHHWLGLHLV